MHKLKAALSRQPSFGRTYLRVNTNDDSSAGSVVAGVVNSAHLASHLLQTLPGTRCCAIAIANASGSRLTCPQLHVNSGAVKAAAPLIIEHGYTGMVGAHKSAYSVSGTVGVLTYELEAIPGLQLQVMWSVPYDFNIYDSWVNVAAGERGACDSLFSDMYRGRHGNVIRAKDTTKIFHVARNIRAEVMMSDSGRCVLVVRLFRD